MRSDPTTRRLAAIGRLCRALAARPDRAWTPRAHFATTRVLLVGRTKVTIACSVHVLPSGATDGPFASSVSIWPHVRRRVSSRVGGWNAALRRVGWYIECERVLRRYGYRGRWRPGPWGRSGDFWRRHQDAASLLAEFAKLQTIAAEPWGSFAAPSNERRQELTRSAVARRRGPRS